MAKRQSANDSYVGTISKTYKSQKASKKQVAALIEEAMAKDKYSRPSNQPMKKIIFRKILGVRVPYILKGGFYVPMDKKS